jgi:hypothetical protein
MPTYTPGKVVLKKDSVATDPNIDPNFANVSLLLHMDGSNDSTTFTDSSSLAHSIAAMGTAKLKTASAKFGSAGLSLDGGGYLRVPSHSSFDMGTGPFTIELWSTLKDQTSLYNSLVANNGPWGSGACSLRFDSNTFDSKVSVTCYTSTGGFIQFASAALAFNQYRHVAIVRNGTSFKLYINGTEDGSATIDASATFDWGSGGYLFVGYSWDGNLARPTDDFDEIRVTKGVARYTANFTPPTEPFPNY